MTFVQFNSTRRRATTSDFVFIVLLIAVPSVAKLLTLEFIVGPAGGF